MPVLLFSETGSISLAVTNALFCTVVAEMPVTFKVIVADAAAATVPSAQVTVRFCTVQLPWDATADASVTPAGSVSVTTTLVAADGPSFCASRDQVKGVPNATGSADSVISRNRSAVGGAAGTVTHEENSDVSLVGLVAVAVTIRPTAALNSGRSTWPFGSVVTDTPPRNVWPSPLPDGSQAVLP